MCAWVILVLLGVGSAMGAHDLSQDYRSQVSLEGDNYIFYWTADLQNKEVAMAINVSTTGWVGFGLSPNGQMPGSDVIIAWVDNGDVQFKDRHAVGRFLPPIDASQDWTLVSGEEQNGRTIIEFRRPLQSCDTEDDLDITIDTARIVWAYHSQDPIDEDDLATLQHERMGSASLNFLGQLQQERVEEDSQSFTILSDNVLIPENDTTYWCTIHALPDEVVTQERYIYKISPVIHEPTTRFVHHVVTYLCSNLDHGSVGAGERCDGTHIDIQLCRFTGILFAAWAVGGTDFVFPDGISYPIGGKGTQFIVLEMHYDNPQMVSGMRDNSGLEFFYTNHVQERAALLTLGQQASSALVVPPNADDFVVNSLYPEQCTQGFLPSNGISIFGSFLHTHIAGRGLVVRHLRRTSECNGGLEELQPVDENRNYDFDYQQMNILPRAAQVLPGDILHLQCHYGTPSYETVTLGGESTREEMCFAFMYYYPETNNTLTIGSQLVREEFSQQHLQPGDHEALLRSFFRDDRQSVSRILDQVEWNPQSIQAFQNAVNNNTVFTTCVNDSNPEASSILSQDLLPQVDCPYVRPSRDCSISKAEAINSKSLFFIFSVSALLLAFT